MSAHRVLLNLGHRHRPRWLQQLVVGDWHFHLALGLMLAQVLAQYQAGSVRQSALILFVFCLAGALVFSAQIWVSGFQESPRRWLFGTVAAATPLYAFIQWAMGPTAVWRWLDLLCLVSSTVGLLVFTVQETFRQQLRWRIPGMAFDGAAVTLALTVFVGLVFKPELQDWVSRHGDVVVRNLIYIVVNVYVMCCVGGAVGEIRSRAGLNEGLLSGAALAYMGFNITRFAAGIDAEPGALSYQRWSGMLGACVYFFLMLYLPITPKRGESPILGKVGGWLSTFRVTGTALLVVTLPAAWAVAASRGVTLSLSACVVGGVLCTGTAALRLLPLLAQALRWQHQFHEAATHDTVTGLINRVAIESLDAELVAASKEPGSGRGMQVMVFSIDLDDFKSVNDLYGHATGDLLLCAVAEVLRVRMKSWGSVLKAPSHVARTGGDEFHAVLVLPNRQAPAVEGAVIARYLTEELARWWTLSDGIRVYAKVSVGVALAPADELGAAIHTADLLMFRAKHSLQHGYADNGAPSPDRVPRQQVRQWVVRALRLPRMPLDLQAVVDVATMQVVSYEVLARLAHPDRPGERLMPAQFLDVIGSDGLHPLLFERVVGTLAVQGLGNLPVHLGLNIDPALLGADWGARWVHEVLHRHGFEPHRITLEITENADVDLATTRLDLEWLSARGYTLAMDDFGVGYSNLGRLGSLPFSILKIDASLVNMAAHGDDSLLAAAQALTLRRPLTLVAEGVATPRHLAVVQRLGIAQVQGFLLARPQSLEALSETWRTQGTSGLDTVLSFNVVPQAEAA